MTLTDDLTLDFTDEAKRTRTVLAVVPARHFDWRPHEKSMTLGALAGHLAECPAWVRGFLSDELDFAKLAADYEPFAPDDKEDLLVTADENAALFHATLATMSDEFLEEEWVMRAGERVLMRAPRHRALREILIHHPIHHRGQLTVYLRELDVPVPPTYGPTADTSGFGTAS